MIKEIDIKIQQIEGNSDLPLPKYMTPGSSGMDIFAAVAEPVTIQSKEFKIIPLGIKIAIPEGYEAQLRPRSGLSAKHGIGMLNGPGTIDSDYRGELKVILFNFGDEPYIISRGDRVAQMVIAPIIKANIIEQDFLNKTTRGEGGFGHTGKSI